MAEMLNIQQAPIFDESLEQFEYHIHKPYGLATFNNSDEIRIAVQNQDLSILPSQSFLHISGRLGIKNADGTFKTPARTSFVNMAICHMFEEIRYELNGVDIDRAKNVGLTSLLKGYVSLQPGNINMLENIGWITKDQSLTNAQGYFDVRLPLNMILGFAEDYQYLIPNAKHELVLTRANSDTNATLLKGAAEETFIKIETLEWHIPYIKVADKERISLLNFLSNDPTIKMSFSSWELYEYPMLPHTQKQQWAIKTSTQLEKPRYIILGFQTNRKNKADKNASLFDHCNIRDVKLHLNSQSYPYVDLNVDITKGQYAILYDMFSYFQQSFYKRNPQPLISKKEYLEEAPLIVIDCSKQNENLKTGPVDIRLEFESKEVFPENTAAYCLILHDRIVEYKPISGTVRKL